MTSYNICLRNVSCDPHFTDKVTKAWRCMIPCIRFSSVTQLCLTFCNPMDARQTSLSITNPQSLLKLMSIELLMPSNHLILCHALLLLSSIFPGIRVFSNELAVSGGQSVNASMSASVLPVNIQGWFPLGSTDVVSLLSMGLSRVFSNTTVEKHQSSVLNLYGPTHICT